MEVSEVYDLEFIDLAAPVSTKDAKKDASLVRDERDDRDNE